jgi:anaerobic ribonucleoside-triphosphate reductase activating protein
MRATSEMEVKVTNKIAIYGDIVLSTVDGPGERAVIHFAGCSIGCPGCFNPQTHDSSAPGVWRDSAQSVARKMLEASPRVTISGGEPTDQFDGLRALLVALREQGCEDIVMFTGRTIEWLRLRYPWAEIESKGLVDVVIDGPFIKNRLATSGMRGSDNQRILPVTPKWSPDDFDAREIEFTLDSEGRVVITGFPDEAMRAILA